MGRRILTDRQWALMAPHWSGEEERSGSDRRGRSAVHGVGFVACANRLALAGASGGVRRLEHGLQALPPLGGTRHVQGRVGGCGYGTCDDRWDDRQGSPPRAGRKRGTRHQAIGRSRDQQDRGLDRRARQPGRLRASARSAPRSRVGALAAFDANWIIEEIDCRRAEGVI